MRSYPVTGGSATELSATDALGRAVHVNSTRMTARRLSKIAHTEPAAATAGQILFPTQQGRILNNYAAPVKA
jgi:hypothetical protein